MHPLSDCALCDLVERQGTVETFDLVVIVIFVLAVELKSRATGEGPAELGGPGMYTVCGITDDIRQGAARCAAFQSHESSARIIFLD
ncbi:hypothetical protein AK37_25085 [Rhodococcus pyridinivorans AK37]|uniref:Uncharacterized protein n=1 Tax=Rhodococcus pyridinivorans AK37 TaxID=1114960 RepID=H0JZ07_9NOCA|nr:hypothetical protein AK37_25085 [Rhodococcus pyridinivorans AK37]